MIGIAATGSGKTLAFLLPAVLHVLKANETAKRAKGPRVLVIAPTRELAMQSAEVCAAVGESSGVSSLCVYGGGECFLLFLLWQGWRVARSQASHPTFAFLFPLHNSRDSPRETAAMREQCRALRNGVDVVVATCGRLCHLVDDGVVSLADVTYLVLDEADRMLDDGFEPQIRKIMGECAAPPARLGAPGGRRTVMFSATWPQEVRKLAGEFLRKGKDCMRVTVGSDDLSANHRVEQVCLFVLLLPPGLFIAPPTVCTPYSVRHSA